MNPEEMLGELKFAVEVRPDDEHNNLRCSWIRFLDAASSTCKEAGK